MYRQVIEEVSVPDSCVGMHTQEGIVSVYVGSYCVVHQWLEVYVPPYIALGSYMYMYR